MEKEKKKEVVKNTKTKRADLNERKNEENPVKVEEIDVKEIAKTQQETLEKLKKQEEEQEKLKIKEQNTQIKRIFISAALLMLIFIIIFMIIHSARNIDYRGVKLQATKEGKLIFYKNAIHMFSATGNHIADYNIYFRNDPRKIKNIPFNGDMVITKNIVLGAEKGKDFQCNGDGIIAIANFANLFQKAMLKNVFKNDTIGCSSDGDWTSIQFYEGKETRIDQVGISCYRITLSNCDILNATERFMYEYLVQINKK